MTTTIKLRRTTTPDNTPASLAVGELALGLGDTPRKLWVGTPSGVEEFMTSVGVTEIITRVQINSGLVNKFRNGTMDVWQRGTTTATMILPAAPSSMYTADGWIVGREVGGVTQVDRQPLPRRPGALTRYHLRIWLFTGMTNLYIAQPIESLIGASLAGQTCTVQFQIYNGTSAVLSPIISVVYFTSLDNQASAVTTDSIPVQSCPPTGDRWTRVACTFNAHTGWQNGGMIVLMFPTTGGGNIGMTEADLRVTPGVPVGINNDPPTPEMRIVVNELIFCQRYYWQAIPPLLPIYGARWAQDPGSWIYGYYPLPVTMRVRPTLTAWWQGILNGTGGGIISLADARTIQAAYSTNGGGMTWGQYALSAANAELL